MTGHAAGCGRILGIAAVAVLSVSGGAAGAGPDGRVLDPPLSERTLSALQRACSPNGIEHLVRLLVLRRESDIRRGASGSSPRASRKAGRLFTCQSLRREEA